MLWSFHFSDISQDKSKMQKPSDSIEKVSPRAWNERETQQADKRWLIEEVPIEIDPGAGRQSGRTLKEMEYRKDWRKLAVWTKGLTSQ